MGFPADTASSTTSKSPLSTLPPEAILPVFSLLDSSQLVLGRRVCKHWLQAIDAAVSLWRIFKWAGEEKYALPAIELFDHNSGSNLREVSIDSNGFYTPEEAAAADIVTILGKSRESLQRLSVSIGFSEFPLNDQLLELARKAPLLETLVIWDRPLAQPDTVLKRKLFSGRAFSCASLRVLWLNDFKVDLLQKLDLSNLASFGTGKNLRSSQWIQLLSSFSSTLEHLYMNIRPEVSAPSALSESLSCPSLRLLEGYFPRLYPAWLHAPNLRAFLGDSREPAGLLQDLPSSVEELWLSRNYRNGSTATTFDGLLRICPGLKVLKVDYIPGFEFDALFEVLRARHQQAQVEAQIEGIKIKPLEKLIIKLELFQSSQIEQLRESVPQVIDLKDYPRSIELEY